MEPRRPPGGVWDFMALRWGGCRPPGPHGRGQERHIPRIPGAMEPRPFTPNHPSVSRAAPRNRRRWRRFGVLRGGYPARSGSGMGFSGRVWRKISHTICCAWPENDRHTFASCSDQTFVFRLCSRRATPPSRWRPQFVFASRKFPWHILVTETGQHGAPRTPRRGKLIQAPPFPQHDPGSARMSSTPRWRAQGQDDPPANRGPEMGRGWADRTVAAVRSAFSMSGSARTGSGRQ